MAQASLEDLAREFGFSMNSECGPATSQKARNAWSEFVGQASFPVDFEERDGDYLLTADVPGLQKADLKVCSYSLPLAHDVAKISDLQGISLYQVDITSLP